MSPHVSRPLTALGFDFSVSASDPASKQLVETLYGGLDGPTRITGEHLHLDVAFATEPLARLMSEVNLRAIDASAGKLLLHAGAVARADGRAAVICGASGSGKSTLSVRLAEHGWHYLTDEVVCLEPETLRLLPYRKPVSLKVGSQALFPHLRPTTDSPPGPWLVPPSAFDRTPRPTGPFEPALLIFPRYEAGSDLEVIPLPESAAAYYSGMNSSRLHDVSGGPLPALARLARRSTAYLLRHGDVEVAARAVADLLRVA